MIRSQDSRTLDLQVEFFSGQVLLRDAFSQPQYRKPVQSLYDATALHLNVPFILVHLVDLRTRYPLYHSLGNSSIEGATLVGVGEVLTLEDLNLPVLLDERDDGDRVVVIRSAIDDKGPSCGLRRADVLDFAMILYRWTNVDDNFPRCFNQFVNDHLSVCISVLLCEFTECRRPTSKLVNEASNPLNHWMCASFVCSPTSGRSMVLGKD
jgi:hypothetical protein